MKLNYKKLNDNATVPIYEHVNDAGMSLRSIHDYEIIYHEITTIKTGISIELIPGYMGLVCPRSGLAKNFGITVVNAPGIIDSGYRGELCVVLTKLTPGKFRVYVGNAIAQLIIVPYETVDFKLVENLNETERGDGGFGSSGR